MVIVKGIAQSNPTPSSSPKHQGGELHSQTGMSKLLAVAAKFNTFQNPLMGPLRQTALQCSQETRNRLPEA